MKHHATANVCVKLLNVHLNYDLIILCFYFLPKLTGFMYVWVDVVCGKLNYRQRKTTNPLCVHELQEDREAK